MLASTVTALLVLPKSGIVKLPETLLSAGTLPSATSSPSTSRL
jgi:hypothetical protein